MNSGEASTASELSSIRARSYSWPRRSIRCDSSVQTSGSTWIASGEYSGIASSGWKIARQAVTAWRLRKSGSSQKARSLMHL
ncbi:hypothetical protein D3C85_1647850 [compost metagenome]